MTSSTPEAISQLRERCSHGAMRRLKCLAPTMHTPHPPSQHSGEAGRGIATTFMIWPLHKRRLSLRSSGLAKLILTIAVLPLAATSKSNASPEEDAKAVAALDTKYQAAVKANDTTTMGQILADDFVLVTGRCAVFSKADLIDSARKKEVTYERQDEEPGSQKVRVWGDTAVVTALLWIKSVQGGKPADYKLWFSDTYVRTPTGWRYVFGQASLPLPKTESK
jgi:ketosteroid isomerase-like protein